jgi:hypothetical protein
MNGSFAISAIYDGASGYQEISDLSGEMCVGDMRWLSGGNEGC